MSINIRIKKKSSNNSQKINNRKKKRDIIVIMGISILLLICIFGFVNYSFLYEQGKEALPNIIYGQIDYNSAKYIRGIRRMSIIQLSINGNIYEISSSWYNSHTYSVEELLKALNSGKDVTVTYVSVEKFFWKEIKNEIIGLQIDNIDYLNAEKGIIKLRDTYRFSKNISLIASIVLFLFIIIYAWTLL